MKHSLPKYLEDIRLSIGDIESYMKGIESSKELENNQLLFDAVCRRFGIIGEALYQADKIESKLHITDKNKIIGLRHIIVHDYDIVRASDIWLIIKNQLPGLKSEIKAILKKFE
ncbi:MAG: DUF86 domain-containing protein [Bacteroidota bacterium]|nr:DUF86 domain-containing protein [Bacteroidota bacterium]